jgi:hypothetical protein
MTIAATPSRIAAVNQFVRTTDESSLPIVEASTRAQEIAALLHEAAETHHVVYRITDGDDPDWASWYADWLLELSELPALLGARPVRSHLVHALVQLDRDFTAAAGSERWEDWYATRLPARLGL